MNKNKMTTIMIESLMCNIYEILLVSFLVIKSNNKILMLFGAIFCTVNIICVYERIKILRRMREMIKM